jgi:hypothetical protein
VRALVEEQLNSDYATYVETGLAGDDAEFGAIYRRSRLSLGSGEFAREVRQAHQEAVGKAARPEDAALRRGSAWAERQGDTGGGRGSLGDLGRKLARETAGLNYYFKG